MAYEILKPEWGENRPIRGVLFDMDGLVLDSEVLYSRFWREACGCFGFEMRFQQSLQLRSQGQDMGQQLLWNFFGPGADYTKIREKRIELMERHVAEYGIPLKPGARELLQRLQQLGIPAAITSASPMEKIREYMDFHGLTPLFTALCSGREVPRGKPWPDIYLLGAARLGLDARDCLALEDSPAGILSAHRAGCLPVMIPDLDQPDENTLPLLYGRADGLPDIITLIERQNGHP